MKISKQKKKNIISRNLENSVTLYKGKENSSVLELISIVTQADLLITEEPQLKLENSSLIANSVNKIKKHFNEPQKIGGLRQGLILSELEIIQEENISKENQNSDVYNSNELNDITASPASIVEKQTEISPLVDDSMNKIIAYYDRGKDRGAIES